MDKLLSIWKNHWWNKTGILPSSNSVSNTNWLHHFDGELHKDSTYCFEQILKAVPYKTAAVQPLTSHLTNHWCKMSRELLEKQRQTNILLWTQIHGHINMGWPAKTYIHQLCADTRCHLDNLPREMAMREIQVLLVHIDNNTTIK